jgi:hypothetical protein
MKNYFRSILIYIYVAFSSFGIAIGGSIPKNASSLDPKVKAINNYINFANESMHGMLIVNKILENYNQELNKYVDVESNVINNFSNNDLPLNVFEDPERLFFNNFTPFEWYDKCIEGSSTLPSNKAKLLNAIVEEMKKNIAVLNKLRLDIDKLTVGKDLRVKSNVSLVYSKLEEGVSAFESFYNLRNQLDDQLILLQAGHKEPADIKIVKDLYKIVKSMITKVRDKDVDYFDQIINSLILRLSQAEKAASLPTSELMSPKYKSNSEYIFKNTAGLIEAAKNFSQDGSVDQNYLQYGKFYYYHNVRMISKFNRYGTGLASELNSLISKWSEDEYLVLELPHIFKVIYPKKLEKSPELESKDDFIVVVPSKLRERRIASSTQIIKADSPVIDLLFYDHMIMDGDIVSINFNGDWILENVELEKAPQKLKLKLNETGKNYLILHAVSVGKRPPNTTAISYKYRGFKKEIILKSDLDTSELIEIQIDK